nr:transposase [Campylobacter jejuni]
MYIKILAQLFKIVLTLIYDMDGGKDVLGLWINEAESKHAWMQVFDELKSRGLEAIGFLSMDGVTGLEDGARAIFPQVVVQRCIVHLIRNSIRYIPRKDWSRFTKDLKAVYGAVNARQARERFEQFQKDWASYPGAVAVWKNSFTHVEQLFSYGSAVRKIMYTTNAIESVNASFRKVTKKGSFPNEDAVFKLLYLRVQELYQKWAGRKMPNWALVRNQLLMDERMANLMERYDTTY